MCSRSAGLTQRGSASLSGAPPAGRPRARTASEEAVVAAGTELDGGGPRLRHRAGRARAYLAESPVDDRRAQHHAHGVVAVPTCAATTGARLGLRRRELRVANRDHHRSLTSTDRCSDRTRRRRLPRPGSRPGNERMADRREGRELDAQRLQRADRAQQDVAGRQGRARSARRRCRGGPSSAGAGAARSAASVARPAKRSPRGRRRGRRAGEVPGPAVAVHQPFHVNGNASCLKKLFGT